MATEIERKYIDVDFDRLREALARRGAAGHGTHFEANLVFDAPGDLLLSQGRLLRLRLQRWPDRELCLLTLKIPLQGAGGCKTMDERELEVQGMEAMRGVLEGLGYAVRARYEKVRETWTLDGALVELDELPFIRVVEVTAPEGGGASSVDRVAEALGLDRWASTDQNYHQLHRRWCAAQGVPDCASFVFDAPRRGAWEARLGLGPLSIGGDAS
ncbi:MAG: class IV adenylate cyclase [Desulfovibrio sp.]|jgi:adenylate cyclase class 2|nr:class IV adenylate cyclase [Desulfovibrio sp.]